VQFACAKCGKALGASDTLVGSVIVCWHCQQPNRVPEPAPTLLRNVSLASVLAELRCPHCGYQLEGLVENLCPECGRRFDPLHLLRKDARAQSGHWTFAWGFFAGGVLVFVVFVALCAGLR
jgi:DNA-directed RNA polymerase subunit RPC12/RpoP